MSPEKFIAIVRDALRDPDLLPSLPQILSSELACDILADLKPVIRKEADPAAANAAAAPLKPKRAFPAQPPDEAGLTGREWAINDLAYGISDFASPAPSPRWAYSLTYAGALDALITSREIIDNLSVEVAGKKASGSTIAKIDELITKAKGGAS